MEAWRPAQDASAAAPGVAGGAGGGRAGGVARSQGSALYRARGPAPGLRAEGPAAAAEGRVPPSGAKTAATNRGPGGRAAASSPLTSSLVILAGYGHPEATHGRDITVHNLHLCYPPFTTPSLTFFSLSPSFSAFPLFQQSLDFVPTELHAPLWKVLDDVNALWRVMCEKWLTALL